MFSYIINYVKGLQQLACVEGFTKEKIIKSYSNVLSAFCNTESFQIILVQNEKK